MKKLTFLVQSVLALLVTMCAAMFYAPTASATTGPPIAQYADAGKMTKADYPAVIVPTAATHKRMNLFRTRQRVETVRTAQVAGFVVKRPPHTKTPGYDYKDDPHID